MKAFLRYLVFLSCVFICSAHDVSMVETRAVSDILSRIQDVIGGDLYVLREIFFYEGFQFLGSFNPGFIMPLDRIFFASKANIKAASLPYYFAGAALSTDWLNFYCDYFEINRVVFTVARNLSKDKMYKFSLMCDFKCFFIQISLMSSGLEFYKQNGILRYIGVSIGRNFANHDATWNCAVGGTYYNRGLCLCPLNNDAAIDSLITHSLNIKALDCAVFVDQKMREDMEHARILDHVACVTAAHVSSDVRRYLNAQQKAFLAINDALRDLRPDFKNFSDINPQNYGGLFVQIFRGTGCAAGNSEFKSKVETLKSLTDKVQFSKGDSFSKDFCADPHDRAFNELYRFILNELVYAKDQRSQKNCKWPVDASALRYDLMMTSEFKKKTDIIISKIVVLRPKVTEGDQSVLRDVCGNLSKIQDCTPDGVSICDAAIQSMQKIKNIMIDGKDVKSELLVDLNNLKKALKASEHLEKIK